MKPVAEQVGLIENLKAVVQTMRDRKVPVFIVPHHRWEPGDYANWKHTTAGQIASAKTQFVAKGSWGGECSLEQMYGLAQK